MMNLRAMVVLFAGLLLAGCSGAGKPVEKAPMAKESGSGYYAEETHQGRIYVLGTEKAHQVLTESQQPPQIAKTYIGAGPGGLTVVLEADSKSSDLQERLRSQYESRHGVKLQ
jgi:hypothetical protein